MARVHEQVQHVHVWLQEMKLLSLLISELTKMLALSYDIRHPSRYRWLTAASS